MIAIEKIRGFHKLTPEQQRLLLEANARHKKVGGANEGRDDGINTVAKIGKCARCGRALSDPVSIRRGLGPTCYKKFANETERVNRLDAEEQVQLESPKRKGGINEAFRRLLQSLGAQEKTTGKSSIV